MGKGRELESCLGSGRGGPWDPDSQQATDTVERTWVEIPAPLLTTSRIKLQTLSKPQFPYLQSGVGKTHLLVKVKQQKKRQHEAAWHVVGAQ